MSNSNRSPRLGPRGSPRHLWTKNVLQVVDGDAVYLSVVFTWQLPAAADIAYCLNLEGYTVTAGGPAVRLMPKYLEPYAHIGHDWPGALQRHNPLATRTTLGCTRRCPWCSAWRIEGDFQELDDWQPAPLVIDNNLLASSRAHFDRVIHKLKPVPGLDFNQGLDARLLTQHHAQRLAELNLAYVRLAWDTAGMETAFLDAYKLLRSTGIPKKLLRIYVLIGTPKDTPDQAAYRLNTLARLKVRPYLCRYQPLNALEKNQYVAPAWTHAQLQKYVYYWNRVRFHSHIPFEDWDPHLTTRKRRKPKGLPLATHILPPEDPLPPVVKNTPISPKSEKQESLDPVVKYPPQW